MIPNSLPLLNYPFNSARTEWDRLWFGQEIRSDFQMFINKNVAKSRVALPGMSRKESYTHRNIRDGTLQFNRIGGKKHVRQQL